MFRGRTFYVKRDDLIDPYLSGNKYRKLYTLIQLPSTDIDTLISYGGNQSNAMYSIAALCYQKGWNFEYYTKKLPEYLKENSSGNFQGALELGMQLHEIAHHDYAEKITALCEEEFDARTRLVRQGGADPLAEAGIAELAGEIAEWSENDHLKALNIITPSGTGTTAFYLAKSLPQFQIYTTALIGSTEYLRTQISYLGTMPENLHIMETKRTYRFGHLYKEYLQINDELHQSGILFDLLYAPKTWLALTENLDKMDGPILYVHSGGVSGNETMLQRYSHADIFSEL